MVYVPCNDNEADFLLSSYKDIISTSYNSEKFKDTSLPLMSSSLPPTSSIHNNGDSDEHHYLTEYNVRPLRSSPRGPIAYKDREEQQQQESTEVQLPPVQFLFTASSSAHYNHFQAEKHQLREPNSDPYSQEQSQQQLQHVVGSSRKKVTVTRTKEKQNIKSSSSTCSNSSNSVKKKTTTISDSNNGHNNKDSANKKRHCKSEGQEDNNKKNKIPKMERPRWSREERYVLLKAILHEKKLKEMRTFHWEHICKEVGKKKKNCKDQWKLELLPSFLDMFSETTGTNEPYFFEEEENDDSDGDTDCDVLNENENSSNNNSNDNNNRNYK